MPRSPAGSVSVRGSCPPASATCADTVRFDPPGEGRHSVRRSTVGLPIGADCVARSRSGRSTWWRCRPVRESKHQTSVGAILNCFQPSCLLPGGTWGGETAYLQAEVAAWGAGRVVDRDCDAGITLNIADVPGVGHRCEVQVELAIRLVLDGAGPWPAVLVDGGKAMMSVRSCAWRTRACRSASFIVRCSEP